jgi:hypothetical protein
VDGNSKAPLKDAMKLWLHKKEVQPCALCRPAEVLMGKGCMQSNHKGQGILLWLLLCVAIPAAVGLH